MFVVVEVAAVALFLRAGDRQWFFLDEWSFLAARELTEVDDLMRPHWGHWVTLPVIAYRGLYAAFGLRSYLPYQAVTLTLHVTVVALLRVVMRRAGVSPWMATIAASMLALFGSGHENVTWAFQMTLMGSLAFGLAHLVLSDHDGPIRGRDWVGLLMGLLGLMCSAVGAAAVLMVGGAALLRRGWRTAAFHTVPLLGVFAGWALVWGEPSPDAAAGTPSFSAVLEYIGRGLAATFGALGQAPVFAWALGAVVVAGPLAASGAHRARDRRRHGAAPLAMALTSVLLVAMVGMARAAAYGPERAGESRYLYLVAALILPWLAYTADAIARRWTHLTPILVGLLLVGLPGNLRAADDRAPESLGQHRMVLTMAGTPALTAIDDGQVLDGFLSPITAGFLKAGVHSGRIEPLPDPRRTLVATATRLLLFKELETPVDDMACETTEPGNSVHLERDDVLVTSHPDARLAVRFPGGAQTLTISAERGRLEVRTAWITVTPRGSTSIEACRFEEPRSPPGSSGGR